MVTFWILAPTCALFLILLGLACWQVEQWRSEAHTEVERHQGCHEAVAAVLGIVAARREANLIRRLAAEYDSMDGQTDIRSIARRGYVEGGPSIPALWMLEQADKIARANPEPAPVMHLPEGLS